MATSASRDPKSDPKAGKPDPKAKTDPKARVEEDIKSEAAPRPKKKRSFVKLALIAIVLLACAGGGAWYFMQGDDAPPATPIKGAKAAPKAAPVSTKPPTFLPLDPFTVNLQNEQQYLQVGLTLRLTDPSYGDSVKVRMPEVRNRVLLLLSSKTVQDLSTLEGKQALSTDIQKEVMAAMGGSVPPGGLSGVLFTSFLIQ